MKKWMGKKTLTALTSVAVAGIAAGTLLNALELDDLFQPQSFEKFENRHRSEDYDYVAGDGDDIDLADEEKDGSRDGGDTQQVLQVAKETETKTGSATLGIADETPKDQPDQKQTQESENHNAITFVDTPETKKEDPAQNSSDVPSRPSGTGDGKKDNGQIPDGTQKENGSGKDHTGSTGNNGNQSESNRNDEPDDNGNGTHGNGSGSGSSENTQESDPTGDNGKNDHPGGDSGNPTKPSRPDQDLTDRDKNQLVPAAPVETNDGTLLGISAVFTRDHYALGEHFSAGDAEVTATFLKNGNTVTKKLSYGGKDGYQVSLSTSAVGTQVAVFIYRGMSCRVRFKVLNSYVDVEYHAFFNNEYYMSPFPGEPLKSLAGSAYDALLARITYPNNYAISGDVIDLTDVHSRMIAYLGDARVRKAFQTASPGGNYQSVIFLEEASDGYLKNMLTGFSWMLNKKLQESNTYVYYPAEEWGAPRSVLDIVAAVPDGYKVRRVTENGEDFGSYHGDQVLEAYTGGGDTVETPRGVTKVAFTQAAKQVRTLKLPNSVQKIDTAMVAECLPALESYAYTDPAESHVRLDYKIIDGILYSADEKTLLSVPAGRKQVTVPETVTKLAKDCFAGMSEDAVIDFESERAPELLGKTGFGGTIRTPDSDYDVVCKAYMFAFGTECGSITFATEEAPEGRYGYDGTSDVLYEKNECGTLAGIPQDTVGKDTVPESIQAIGAGAFAGCTKLTDIELPETVTSLQADSLVLPSGVTSVTLRAEYTNIDPSVFGNPMRGMSVPAISIYVPEASYADYLQRWSEILDPVYGEGTAKRLLATTDGTVFYEDGAKYQTVHYGNETGYRLLNVYQKAQTAFRVKNGTREIVASAFSGCTQLEILYLPQSLQALTSGQLMDCTALRMIVSEQAALSVTDAGLSEAVELFRKGETYSEFLYEDDIVYGVSSNGGKVLLCVPTDYRGVLEVQAGTECIYKESAKGCTGLTGIAFSDMALTELQEGCFRGCTSLAKLNLTDETLLQMVGTGAFEGCTSLETVQLPEGVMLLGDGAFRSCTALKSITATGVKEIGAEVFYNCSLLSDANCLQKTVLLGDRSFYACQGLKEVALPETLTQIGESCFANCTAVTDVTLNGTLTAISRYCFGGCRELRRISFGERQRERLRVIGVGAFESCINLENLDLDMLTNLTYLGAQAFTNCVNLVRIRFPEQLQTLSDGCFSGCTNLSVVRLYATAVMELGDAVFGDQCDPFIRVQVPEAQQEAYLAAWKAKLDTEYGEGTAARLIGILDETHEEIRGVLFEITDEGRILKKASPELSGEYVVPEDTIRIGDDAFAGCTQITAVGVTKNTTLSLGNRCFKGCTGLQTLVLGGDVTDWGDETFMDCTGLTRAIIGNDLSTNIPRIGVRAFKNCTGFSTAGCVSIRSGVEVYDTECFAGCSNLPAFSYLVSARTALREIGDSAFYGCSGLTAFLTSAYTSVERLGARAFAECDTLKQPSIPASVKSIGEGCFMGCDNLMYVSFYGAVAEYPKDCFRDCPKLVRTGGTAAAFAGLKRIGENAYAGCRSLVNSTSWNLGRYSALEEIGDGAFSGCTGLADSILSATVTRIGAGAFSGCTNMKTLTIKAETLPAIGAIDLASMADGFRILVPDSEAQGDVIYRAYLKMLRALLGKDKAYEILDSVSDGAKNRYEQEEESESESESEGETEGESEPEAESESEEESERQTERESETGPVSDQNAGADREGQDVSNQTEPETAAAQDASASGTEVEAGSTEHVQPCQTEAAPLPESAETVPMMTETVPSTGFWQAVEAGTNMQQKAPQTETAADQKALQTDTEAVKEKES